MDISSSIVPKSDQLNADDLITGPVTVTIANVTAGNAEQPFDFNLLEYPGRAYRPSKGMRRVIINAWGKETSAYAGRKLTLYRDPEVTFGREKTGGIRISHLSHIDSPKTLPLTVTRGKRKDFTVQPLTADVHPAHADVQPADQILAAEWISTIQEATTTAQLQAAWAGAVAADVARDPKVIAAKDARKLELS